MYIPNKTAKFVLKVVMMNDTRTSYMINAIPYVGLSNEERATREAEKSKKVPKKHDLKPRLHRQKQLQKNRNQSPQ